MTTTIQESKAYIKNLKGSPQKVGVVLGLIRGKQANKALHDLAYCRRRVSKALYGLLYSAVSNAENNHGMDVDKLCVTTASVGRGMTLKRMHARGRGRGARVKKHYSNVTIILREKETN